MVVIVECSANRCRFKNNDGYYGICRNPESQKDYKEFAGGRVQVSGCVCSSCKADCGVIPEMMPVN